MSGSGSSEKRRDYIDWDVYFMATAFMEKHFEPTLQNVALVLNPRKIIANMQSSIGKPNCKEHAVYKVLQGIPANCDTLYTINYPCNECAQEIVKNDVKKIFYFKGDEELLSSKELFKERNVVCSKLKKSEIDIDFVKFYNEKTSSAEERNINANPNLLTINNNIYIR